MINSFLGRMHLASHLELLTDEQLGLVKEGVEYYKTLSEVKKKALPCFPNGFTRFGDESVVAGFETHDKIYFAVWNLKNEQSEISFNLSKNITEAKIAYPSSSSAQIKAQAKNISVMLKKGSAIFLEIR